MPTHLATTIYRVRETHEHTKLVPARHMNNDTCVAQRVPTHFILSSWPGTDIIVRPSSSR